MTRTELRKELNGDLRPLTENGDSPGKIAYPPLTTIDIHTYEMGKEAILALEDRMITKRNFTKKVEVQASLVCRSSVGMKTNE